MEFSTHYIVWHLLKVNKKLIAHFVVGEADAKKNYIFTSISYKSTSTIAAEEDVTDEPTNKLFNVNDTGQGPKLDLNLFLAKHSPPSTFVPSKSFDSSDITTPITIFNDKLSSINLSISSLNDKIKDLLKNKETKRKPSENDSASIRV